MIEPTFKSLPTDNFGVHVDGDMDERRLLWLANAIGEKKLRDSAKKRGNFPESKLFVSTLLKRFKLKVPPSFYSDSRVPINRVYVLVLRDHTAVKIGITQYWPNRVYDFVKTANYTLNFNDQVEELFDINLSLAFYAGSKGRAREIEGVIKKKLSGLRAPSPRDRGLLAYGVSGKTEWFFFPAYGEMLQILMPLGKGDLLRDSLLWENLMQSNCTSKELPS